MNDTPRHRAKKSLGQNFLIDQNICRKIVDAVRPGEDDFIIEIGPGQGALTGHLAGAGVRKLVAIEMDDSLAQRLNAEYPLLEVVRMDATKYPWSELNETGPCKIIGNLPYNVGSKLIWDIVSTVTTLERAVFMVQHEVAQRLTAEPGNKTYGGLTAWVKNFCTTNYLFKVPPTVFRPKPKVDSAVVSFSPLPVEARLRNDEKEGLARLIKQLFQQRRKQVRTILKKQWTPEVEQWFVDQGIEPTIRPEKLTPEQFASLSRLF